MCECILLLPISLKQTRKFTKDPVWGQAFTFFVHSAPSQSLHLEVSWLPLASQACSIALVFVFVQLWGLLPSLCAMPLSNIHIVRLSELPIACNVAFKLGCEGGFEQPHPILWYRTVCVWGGRSCAFSPKYIADGTGGWFCLTWSFVFLHSCTRLPCAWFVTTHLWWNVIEINH